MIVVGTLTLQCLTESATALHTRQRRQWVLVNTYSGEIFVAPPYCQTALYLVIFRFLYTFYKWLCIQKVWQLVQEY